ncbi:MAG TPA: nitroreductase [Acidimicrobiaceae bacterium]|nr:nitroreductase [Acidimicrobiaceae bacterium]
MPEFFDVVRSQRACRAFAPDPLSDELVEQVLEAATHAPSAENRQPWVFVVVRDDKERAVLGELTRRAWEGGGRRHSERRLAAGLLRDVDHGATGGVAAAPVVVVVCADTEAVSPAVLEASIFPAVQNLLLAAGALGLGSALTTLPLAFSAEMADALGLPDALRPVAVVPLGRPARPLGAPKRRPVSEVAHRERFGAGW